MSWVRLDDGYPEHPKVDRVGPLAAWLNVCAWAYCARNLTDGLVPDERVPRLAQVKNAKALAGLLVESTLWERVDGGYRVHDYLAYNPSRETVLKERAESAQRAAEYRARRTNGVSAGVSNGVTQPVTHGVSADPPVPGPVPKDAPSGAVREPVPKPRRERVVITDGDIEALVAKYAERYGSPQAVRDEIELALNHQARFKNLSERLYVDGWLRKELTHRPGQRVVNGRTEPPRKLIDRTGIEN